MAKFPTLLTFDARPASIVAWLQRVAAIPLFRRPMARADCGKPLAGSLPLPLIEASESAADRGRTLLAAGTKWNLDRPMRVTESIMICELRQTVTRAPRLLRILAVFLLCSGALAEPPAGSATTGEFVLGLTLADLVSSETAAQLAGVIAVDERIEWQVYVPPSYDPARPAGLMVYISPTPSGEIPRGWQQVLDTHNVIWIGADRAGNSELVARRVLFALLATSAIQQQYAIDAERIYVSGLSGGGKTASMVATDQAQLFRGAIYNCGVEFWDKEPERLEQIRQNHYVFVTGTYDQALRPTKRAYRAYLRAGVENSKLMVINKMTHRNPDSYEFEEALEYLDSRLQPDR